jgi:1,4-dihydroxy-2-naphthoate octaprenyltransferase
MYLWIIGAVIARIMPVFTLIALFTLPFAIKAIQGAFKPEDMNKLVPGMANNVMVVLITQFLMGAGYILSRVSGIKYW